MKQFKIRASQIGKIMGNAKKAGELSAGCITFLKEWYAEQMYGDREEIKSKYCDKGNACEDDAIDFVAEITGLGFLMKNEKSFENEYITGTPDVLVNGEILDTKCSWNGKTFLDSITDELNTDYEWQIRGYMNLTGYGKGRVCYCLMDTPDFVNYGNAVSYSTVQNKARYFEFFVDYDEEKDRAIIEKVEKCREWLNEYDNLISSLLY
jgi:hypothetical protein